MDLREMDSKPRKNRRRRIPLALTGLLIFAIQPNWEPARVIRVISGDTLTIQYNSKWEEIKMVGIKTPDIHNNNSIYNDAMKNSTTLADVIRKGQQSQNFLRQQVRYGSQIWIEFDTQKRDRFGRMLGYIYLPNGRMLNQMILEEGYAFLDIIPPNLKYQDRLSLAFMHAKEEKRGYWRPEPVFPPPPDKRKIK